MICPRSQGSTVLRNCRHRKEKSLKGRRSIRPRVALPARSEVTLQAHPNLPRLRRPSVGPIYRAAMRRQQAVARKSPLLAGRSRTRVQLIGDVQTRSALAQVSVLILWKLTR